MIRRALIALALVVGLTSFADAQTWPRDNTGWPGSCGWFDSAGRGQPCTPTNPLPVATVNPNTPVAGTNWQVPTQSGGGNPNGPFAMQWTGPNNLLAYTTDSVTAPAAYVSANSGRSFIRQGAISTAFPNPNGVGLSGVLLYLGTVASGQAVLGGWCGTAVAGNSCSPFETLSTSSPLTTTAATVPAALITSAANDLLQVASIKVQGSTIEALVFDGFGGGNKHVWSCQSSTAQTPPGSNWTTCTDESATFTTTLTQRPGGGDLATPAANTWLTVMPTGAGKAIFRSTDNGVTWTSQFTFVNDSGNIATHGVECLTSLICVATSSNRIARSTDAGNTWTQVYGPNEQQFGGFVNFGNGYVMAVADEENSNTATFWYSTDFGNTWQGGPLVSLTSPGGTANDLAIKEIAVNGNQAMFSGMHGATNFNFGYSSPTPPGTTTLVDAAGNFLSTAAGVSASSAVNVQGITGGTPMVVNLSGASTQNVVAAEGVGLGNSGNNQPWSTMMLYPGNCTFTGCNKIQQTTTSAANTAQTINVATPTNMHAWLYEIDAFCSAGTATLTVTDNSGTIWSISPATVGTAKTIVTFPPWGIQNNSANFNVNVGACGAGNTSTVFVNASVF